MGKRRVAEPRQRDYAAEGLAYARDVVDGVIDAGEMTRLACKRHVDEVDRWERGEFCWLWNPDAGNRACRFIENLEHVKGRWKTATILLEPWQCFIITAIFGWQDGEGFRRFRTAYIEVPRKNAKTTLCAGIALYMLCADGEPGAEVYSAAVTRDQAKIVWEIAKNQVKRDPDMQEFYSVSPQAHAIIIPSLAASFKPLARDADSLEGLSPHCAVVDELHAHKTREVWDVLNVARGSRRQSLLLGITTAGENKTGVCYEQHSYVEKILRGRHEDDRYFGIIYHLDDNDDWTTEAAARKANPNYGVSVLPEDIMALCRQAQQSSDSQNTYQMKRLNIWTTVGTAFFNILAWDRLCRQNERRLEDFHGRSCVITLDLASTRDLTTKIYSFEEDGVYYLFGRHYLPEAAKEYGRPNYDLYRGWTTAGHLILTDGERTNYAQIEEEIGDDRDRFDILAFGCDPAYNGEHLTQRVQSEYGIELTPVTHTVMSFTDAMKTLDAMIVGGDVKHDGDPVLGWAMGNVVAKRDVKGNVYPRRARDVDKIDPAVALIANVSIQLRMKESSITYTGLRSIG